MRPHYVSHAPFTEWVLAVSVYLKNDWYFLSPGRLYAEAGLPRLPGVQ